MSRQVQIRRGSATAHSNFTGAIGEITMDITNKTLCVHDGETVGGIKLAKQSEIPTIPDLTNADYIVEFQTPTADNNYTWYRKYKSGWIEQGGIGNTSSSTFTVNLPVNMSDANYTALLQTESGRMINIQTKTTTSLTAWFSDSYTGKYNWYISGIL